MRGHSHRAVSPVVRRPKLKTEAKISLESLYNSSGLTRGGSRFRPLDSATKRPPLPSPSKARRPVDLIGRPRSYAESTLAASGSFRRNKSKPHTFFDPTSGSSSRVARQHTGSRDPTKQKDRRRVMPFTASTASVRQKRMTSAPEALTVKEQIVQIVAILFIAAVVASVGFSIIGWISDLFKPYCTPEHSHDCFPCSEHGICTEQELQCVAGYKRKGRECVPDLKIDQNAAKLVRFIQDYVCTKHSQSICDGIGSVWIPKDELAETIREAWLDRQFGVDDERLPLVQERAFKHINELLSVGENSGRVVYQCPGDVVNSYKPLGCRLREWAWRNIVYLLLSIPLVSLGTSLSSKFVRRRRTLAKALNVYERVCEELEDKALNADGQDNVSWVVASRLRDHLLSVRERKNLLLWSEVERLVNEDSRIDQYPKLIKGEMKTVWEWQVEGALRSPALRRRGQRVRFAGSSPLQGKDCDADRGLASGSIDRSCR